jgi:hypothetical protein
VSASGGAGAAPPPKTTAPASWRLTLPWALGITWCGLVGDRGHRKGQLRVLGSPSALRTKEPRTGGAPGGGGESTDPIFLRKPLDTYLRALKPACGPPGPIDNILATARPPGSASRAGCKGGKASNPNTRAGALPAPRHRRCEAMRNPRASNTPGPLLPGTLFLKPRLLCLRHLFCHVKLRFFTQIS